MPLLPDPQPDLDGCRALYLQQLGTLLADTAPLSPPAIAAIQHGAGIHFDEMVHSRRRGSFKEEAKGLTSSRITLVGDDQLELEIRLDKLCNQLLDAGGDKLWKVHRRFVTLLRRPEMPKENNPVGPDGIARGLHEMFAAATLTLDQKLELLDPLGNALFKRLPALYSAIDDFLEQAGIETAQPAIVTRPEPGRNMAPPTETLRPLAVDPVYALHRSLLARQTPSLSAGAAPAPAVEPLGEAAREQLNFRLDELNRQGVTPRASAGRGEPSLEALIPGLFAGDEPAAPAPPVALVASALGVPPASREGLAIDTLAVICDAIMDDPGLPEALKTAISSLRVILLKCALDDPELFTDDRHPARQLLDRMAIAMRGLPDNVPATHPVGTRLIGIAERLRRRPGAGPADIGQAITETDELITERNAAVAHAAEPYIPLLHQLERRDHAALQARLALDRLARQGIPPPIRDFLDRTWNRVLQLVLLEYGAGSSHWQAHVQAIEDLLWTFRPKSGTEERKEMARRLPEVLRLLKAGMERIGMPAAEQDVFLDQCFALQTRALRSTPNSPENPDPQTIDAGALPRSRPASVAGEIQSGNLLLVTLDFTERQPAPPRALPCETGDWLEISVDRSTRRIARLCYLSPGSQRALFCNPELDLALAIHPVLLDQQLRSNRARILGAPRLFGNAIARVLERSAAG